MMSCICRSGSTSFSTRTSTLLKFVPALPCISRTSQFPQLREVIYMLAEFQYIGVGLVWLQVVGKYSIINKRPFEAPLSEWIMTGTPFCNTSAISTWTTMKRSSKQTRDLQQYKFQRLLSVSLQPILFLFFGLIPSSKAISRWLTCH